MSIEPKKAYVSKCIYKCVTMYECTSVVNRAFYDFFLKKQTKTMMAGCCTSGTECSDYILEHSQLTVGKA